MPDRALDRNYARADFDRTINFIQSYIYELPFGKGKHFLSTQALAARSSADGRFPGFFRFAPARRSTFTGSNSLNLGSGGNATLDQIAPVQVLGGINTGNPWFSTASFAKAATNVQGTTGRNIWSGPNLFALERILSRWIASVKASEAAAPAGNHQRDQYRRSSPIRIRASVPTSASSPGPSARVPA